MTNDPMEMPEFYRLMCEFRNTTFDVGIEEIRAYLRPHLKPPEPPVSEPATEAERAASRTVGARRAKLPEATYEKLRTIVERDTDKDKPQPTPREVRREFADADGERYAASCHLEDLPDRVVGLSQYEPGSARPYSSVVYSLESSPDLARIILEVHAEASAPDPPRCPWCGHTAGRLDNRWKSVRAECPCGCAGPWVKFENEGERENASAEALAAFAGPRKGEG